MTPLSYSCLLAVATACTLFGSNSLGTESYFTPGATKRFYTQSGKPTSGESLLVAAADSLESTSLNQDFADCKSGDRQQPTARYHPCSAAHWGPFGFGIIKRSTPCFDDFISPVSNPFFFEDPRNLTEARFIFLNQNLPSFIGGRSIQVYAAQARVALSDRLSLIVTKSGFSYTQIANALPGFLDVAPGFKYNLFQNPDLGMLLSVGTTLDIPLGTPKAGQGNGDGEFHFFATAGTRLLGNPRMHWLTACGLRQPANQQLENRIAYWSNHLDYRLTTRLPLFVFTEFNWWHYLADGAVQPTPLEGGDLVNLGSQGIKGNDLVIQALGIRVKPKRNMELGTAYEFPLTERRGLMRDRLTMDLILRY